MTPLLLPRRALLAGAAALAAARPAPLRAAAGPPVLVRLEPRVRYMLPLEREHGHYAVTWAGPPRDFDALRADTAQLAAYGLPPRPAAGGEALAAWERAAAAWRFAAPDWQDHDAARPSPAPNLEPRVREFRRAPIRVPGENWGGAYVRATGETRLAGVAGRWRVPDSAPPGGDTTRDYRCSHWIGLDGCDPTSRSLPQCGTLRAFGEGAEEERALWWQWWLAGGSRQSGNTLEFAVPGSDPGRWQGIIAGDLVEARISVPNPADLRTVRFWFRVDPAPRFGEPPVFLAFDVTLQPHANNTRLFGLTVEGRVAEWVIERPMRTRTRDRSAWLYPLPAFDAVTFEDCRTWLADGAPGPDLRHARALRITDWSDADHLGRVVARVRRPMTEGSMRIDYTGPR